MATRCNIIIEYGETRVYIYRHWDGYPACTGADIAQAAHVYGHDASALLRRFLDAREQPDCHHPNGRHHYEITSDVHGDIEWLYWIRLGRDRYPRLAYRETPIGSDLEAAVTAPNYISLREFAAYINSQIREQNARLEELRVKHPPAYADCAPTPEVDIGRA